MYTHAQRTHYIPLSQINCEKDDCSKPRKRVRSGSHREAIFLEGFYLIGKAKLYRSCTFITKRETVLQGEPKNGARLVVPDLQLSSWPFSASCGSSRAPHRTASLRPPRTGPACSTCWCEAARCTPRRLACSGRARRRGGWPPAGESPRCCRCRPAAAQRRS